MAVLLALRVVVRRGAHADDLTIIGHTAMERIVRSVDFRWRGPT
jgi:hypothetical protein